PLNRINKKGARKGKWIIFLDSARTIKSFEGRFRNGKPVGRNYFYNNEGVLERLEINRFKKMKTTFYYPTGVVRMKGLARLENLPDKIHYYFYGKWQFYNDSGTLVKYYHYNKGELIKTEYVDKNNKTNDSLMKALSIIDQDFTTHNTVLVDSINANLKNAIKYKNFKTELRYKDSISFEAISTIIDRYGYPSDKIAGDVSGVPFYILGFAPVSIKEKYLNELILAADRGFIAWSSLAFYIDKIKVAKGEKQIYGTQGTYDKDYNYTMYPVTDPERLNDRRKKVGLEELE
ncbi:MAG: hypothetical protein V4677_00820, partial [Bacteroidota bacterium]